MSMGSTPFGTDGFSVTLTDVTNTLLGANQYGYNLYEAEYVLQLKPWRGGPALSPCRMPAPPPVAPPTRSPGMRTADRLRPMKHSWLDSFGGLHIARHERNDPGAQQFGAVWLWRPRPGWHTAPKVDGIAGATTDFFGPLIRAALFYEGRRLPVTPPALQPLSPSLYQP